jgi:type VI secretion system protein ImpK
VFARLAQLRLAAPAVAAPAPPALARPRLAITLGPEIKQGLLTVTEDGQRSVVLIQGDGLFAPGSAQLDDRVLPVLARVGAALHEHPGTVRVTGHTDAQPIRSARFPSNWHLSQERAREVARILGDSIGAQRLQAEGRADAEPVAPNDTPANRARNRRVEITLFATR